MTRDPNEGRATFYRGERDGGASVRAFMKSTVGEPVASPEDPR